MGYRLDRQCGVHYYVDEEFERNRFSALQVLNDPKYNACRGAYEDAYRHMDSTPQDTKAAVRSIFEALEILVKQMIETPNLNRRLVKNALKEKCLNAYSDTTARNTTSGLFDSFGEWVNALHNYRHGQNSEEPIAPSEIDTIYIMSSGSSYLRWLINIKEHMPE